MITAVRTRRPTAQARDVRGGVHLIKMMVVALGSGLPAYLVSQALSERDLMIRFWGTLLSFSVGWYVSRTFVRKYLDL